MICDLSTGNSASTLDRLQGLLQRQLELIHRGHLPGAVALFDETDRCVQEILGSRTPVRSGAAEQWGRLERLYRELSLALAAQQAEVATALRSLRQSKKVLQTYGASRSSP